jgi:hypothetical protein
MVSSAIETTLEGTALWRTGIRALADAQPGVSITD